MDTSTRLNHRKALLRNAREDLARHRICSEEANRQLRAVMLKIFSDPAHTHLHYSEVGRLYVERERALTRASLTEGSCLTLRQEIAPLKQQLANE